MVDPAELEPPNRVNDHYKVGELSRSMEENGWEGYPIVVHEGRALNGSHRLLAAQKAGVSVPTMTVADVARMVGLDLDNYIEDGRLVTDRLMRDWYRLR